MGTEAPVMPPNGVNFSFLSSHSLLLLDQRHEDCWLTPHVAFRRWNAVPDSEDAAMHLVLCEKNHGLSIWICNTREVSIYFWSDRELEVPVKHTRMYVDFVNVYLLALVRQCVERNVGVCVVHVPNR